MRSILRRRPQAKLRIGRADDPREIEADRVAAQVTSAAPAPARRPDDAMGGRPEKAGGAPSLPGGESLPETARAFFEPRFGRSFSDVRVHADTAAAEAAQAMDARAFTLGRDIFFGRGEYSPGSGEGRRLLAHELTHVGQNGGGDRTLRRTPSASSSCAANTHGAPADPPGRISFLESMGHLHALMADLLLSSDANFMRLGIGGSMSHRRAYESRFGRPEASGSRFRNRFTGATFATEDQAIIAELESLSSRYGRIADFLSGNVRYICSGRPGTRTVGNCRDDCRNPDRLAWVCAGGPRTIVLCPEFWNSSTDEQAFALIHEAAHILFGIRAHGSGSVRARGRNAECYASLVADTRSSSTADSRCPPI